jgi:hypothetical protein
VGHEQGGPCRPMSDARPAAAQNWQAHVMGAVRTLSAEQRGRGEADRWATATVPSGGDADERGPSGSGRGRVGREWRAGVRIDDPRGGELSFLFVF